MSVPYVDLGLQNVRLQEQILSAVERVIRHGRFVLGPEVEELERRLRERLDVGHVITVASGLDALVLALRLEGIGEGDEVLVPSHTFVATALAVSLCGARPVFVDIEPRRLLMDVEHAESVVTSRTRAIVPVHLAGHPCDMEQVTEVAARHDLRIIEDCAQSLGSRYRERQTGSFGTGCFSLHPLKPLSALGDAGFITVRDQSAADRLRLMRNMGLADRDHCVLVSGHSRLDTVQAAILLAKLAHLDGFLAARRANARFYDEALAGKFRLIEVPPDVEPSYSAYVVRHPDRDRIREAMLERGYDVKVHYPIPVHRQEAYRGEGTADLPETDRAVSEILSLPISPELSEREREAVTTALLELA